jgi:thiol-disulfide isomerase/thioredoxin
MRVSGLLILPLIVLGAAAPWIAAAARPPHPVPAALPDYPEITSCSITPATLKNNRINFIRFYLKFKDDGKNLYGGFMCINFKFVPDPGQTASRPGLEPSLPVLPGGRLVGAHRMPDGTWTAFYNLPFREAVFKNAMGEFVLYFGLLAEKYKTVTISPWLSDAKNNHSNQVEVVLNRSTESSGPKQGYKVGQLAYDFTLLDKSNNRKTLSTYLGKVVLLNLCTMWCGPCKEEMPHLQSLYKKYKAEGLIIMNGICENYAAEPIRLSDLAKWVKAYHTSFPVLADLFYGVYNPYNAFPDSKSFPFNILVDRTGKIRWKKYGFGVDIFNEMEAKILQLLAE